MYAAANSVFLWLIVPNIKKTSHVGNPNNIFNSIFINGTYKWDRREVSWDPKTVTVSLRFS